MRILVQAVMLGLCFGAGYFTAVWWSGSRDRTPLAQLCARIDYVNGLQLALDGQQAASKEVRDQFEALLEQCRAALRDRTEEQD